MTELLVDTHVLLWALAEPGKLTPAAEDALADPDTIVWVSAASAWEIATKVRIGKLPGAESLILDYAQHLERWCATPLPIDSADSILAGSLVWDHRDPFDRMIVAQAIRRGLPLVSADEAFDSLAGADRLW
ncbi:PIN domain nuclease [Brachybacterium vulturis]|uniref:PIN domain nuclease n=1 Tax=Brachybacterium vulturis TaxID=2017484 RepID=A0A291GJL7_9MICO|nr:type II toxin-antitoxin system VapC family toxin [Brachybacterium vulturis]ATG50260.1 PIN domain nuclease [Brachybacterium vulturis]